MDGDGRPDIAVSNQIGNTAGILLNSGSGTFGVAQLFGLGDTPNGIALADLNGDGMADLSTANMSGRTVSVWLNATVVIRLEVRDAAGATVATGLPTADLVPADGRLIVATRAERVVGVVGLEPLDARCGLLRSLAVARRPR